VVGTLNEFDYRVEHDEEQRIAAWPGWGDVYRAAFPGLIDAIQVTDTEEQLRGIDRRLVFDNRSSLTVDEKYDKHSTGNFFLETVSVLERNTPGWVMGHLECDYLGYLFRPLRQLFLIDYRRLCEAWARHENVWAADYPLHTIKNRGYVTVGVTVPAHVVLDAIDGCIRITRADKSWVRSRA
jgi:hypothetical protein